MKRIAVITSLFFGICLLQAQDFHFAYDMGGTGSDFGRDIATDKSLYYADGSYYVTGTHTGTVDFDPSPGVQTRTSAGMQDVFIAKYDSAGNLLWVTDFGGSLNDVPNSISVYWNDVYVTGLFRGTVDFDPGFGSTTRTASGDADVFLVKFNGATGAFEWVVTFGGSATGNTEGGIGVEALSSGVYVTGTFEGTNINVNPNSAFPVYISSTGDQNIFMARYGHSNGIIWWAKSLGSTTLDDEGLGIVADNDHVYICGSFAGSSDFNPGVVGGTLTSVGGNDGFIASYTYTGTYRWAHRIGGPLNDEVNDIDMDINGHISVTGTVFGNVSYTGGGSFTTNAGSQDAFVAQLSDQGTFNWAHPLGGPGANDEGNTVAMTPCGEVYVGGKFCSTADFNPGTGTANLTGPACGFPNPDYSYFLASYDENGNYQWAEGGSATGGDSEILGIDLDLCNSLVATGGYSRMQDFDMTQGTYNLFPAGGTDAFVSKHFLPKIIVYNEDRRYLERAVNCANVHIGRDTIAFCLPGNGPHIFDMYNGANPSNTGPLPYITDDYTIIDATTQPGWAMGNIVIDGNGFSGTTYGLRFGGCDHGEALGLSVRRFSAHGIYAFDADHVTVRDCQVGGHVQDGIRFYNSAYGTVQSSVIGLNASANAADPNGRDGIATNGTSNHLQVGGTTAASSNYIGSNTRYGIYLRTDHCQVEGNGIGTNTLSSFGNGSHGIYIEGDDNQIGNASGNGTNYIAFNGGHGIEVFNSTNFDQNHFWGNAFYCNNQSAIEINVANQGIASPTISLADASGIYGTGVPGAYIEIYAPDSFCLSNACQGRYLLGSTNIDGSGNWGLSGSFNGGQQVLAIQTDANLNTSEFSNCVTIQTLLAQSHVHLTGTSEPTGTYLTWEYPSLQQSTLFQLERSTDTSHWELIQSITAETGAAWSELTDRAPAPGFYYYRVGMWLEDGQLLYSNVVGLVNSKQRIIQFYPNPASDFVQVNGYGNITHFSLTSMSGKIIFQKEKLASNQPINLKEIPNGIYVLTFHLDSKIYHQTLIINHQ